MSMGMKRRNRKILILQFDTALGEIMTQKSAVFLFFEPKNFN